MRQETVVDLPYEEYVATVRRITAAPVEGFACIPSGRYRRAPVGEFEPVRLPGCTILAEPYPMESERKGLTALQRQLTVECPEFAAVPSETLHMTVADLLVGDSYLSLGAAERNRIRWQVSTILEGSLWPGTLSCAIAGIGVLGPAVVAAVHFGPDLYDHLVRVRRDVYRNRDLNIPQRSALLGHITLGYVEIEPPEDGADDNSRAGVEAMHGRAEEAVIRAREAFAARVESWVFDIVGASVFTFPHMSRFTMSEPSKD